MLGRIVAHTDSRFDVDSWCGYVRAYQEVQHLTIGELWASAITLRLVLIENLRRIADRVVYSRNERSKADELADRLLGVDGRNAEPSATIETELERTELPDAFLVQLIHRLRDRGPAAESLLTHLDKLLTAGGKTADDSVHDEQERQVAANVDRPQHHHQHASHVRCRLDGNFRTCQPRSTPCWPKAAPFADMDFPTRNLYRTAVEELARGFGLSELEVARRAVSAGAQATSGQLWTRTAATDRSRLLSLRRRPRRVRSARSAFAPGPN